MATLNIVFYAPFETNKVPGILENEFRDWAQRYPVFIMASAFDETGGLVDLSSIKPKSHLTGFYDPKNQQLTMLWGLVKNEEVPTHLIQEEHLRKIYSNLKYRTGKQIKEKVSEDYRKVRIGKRIILSWFFVWLLGVPVTIEILGRENPIIADLAVAYSLWKAWKEFSKLAGYAKKSHKEIKHSEKERKMQHYFYHCEMNPEAFQKLKFDNFEKEAKERIRNEAAELY